jgi:hypothetical protein
MTTPPSSPEELRLRHRRIGLAWEMTKSRHTNRAWLPERCVDAFRKLSDHVLWFQDCWLAIGKWTDAALECSIGL